MTTTPLHAARGWGRLCLLVAGLAAICTPSATAAAPCGDAVLLDWSDGRIDRTYAPACYRDALARLPEDLRAYSTAPEDIQRALLERVRAGTSARERPRSLAGPTRTPPPATTQEDDDGAAAAPGTQPPSGPDSSGDAVAAPVTSEPDMPDRTALLVLAALALLALGAAVPLVRALAGRRRSA
jgi:hypothetical protein